MRRLTGVIFLLFLSVALRETYGCANASLLSPLALEAEESQDGGYGLVGDAQSDCRSGLAKLAPARIWRKVQAGMVALDPWTHGLCLEVMDDPAARGGG